MQKCIVKSADMIPLRPVDIRKAISLLLRGSVYVLAEYEDVFVRSVTQSFRAPKEVATKRFVKLPEHFYGPATLNPKNLRKRDNDRCQYCGRNKNDLHAHEFLTMDHILPQSRGGPDEWENVVLACVTCNNRKGCRTPQEAGMKLLKTPVVPTRWQL